MKEITRVITARATMITKVDDEGKIISRERSGELFKQNMEQEGFDDVVVDNVQDFVVEKEDKA